MVGGREEEEHFLSVGDRQLEIMEEFKHLRSVIHRSGSAQSDIEERITIAFHAFGKLRKFLRTGH